MKQLIFIMIIMIMSLILVLESFAWRETEISGKVHLPPIETIEIIPPSPDLPKEIAAFSGRWEGRWSGGPVIPSVLIVEKIDPEHTAQVIYSIGTATPSHGIWKRYKAKIANVQLQFFTEEGNKITFKMKEGFRSIEGLWVPWRTDHHSRPLSATTTFVKIED